MMMRCCALMLIAWLISSCNTSDVSSTMVDVDSQGWTSPAEVTLTVDDTLSMFDLGIALRYEPKVVRDSLELLVTTVAPDGVRWSESVTIYPESSQATIENYDAPYLNGVKWSMLGDYKIQFAPKYICKGVHAVGVNTFIHR